MNDLRKLKLDLGAYLSLRNELQLITKCVEPEDIENMRGVPYQIICWIGGNFVYFWSIDNARRVIDYRPKDDAIEHFADHVARILGEG